jgi:hypothetical protein
MDSGCPTRLVTVVGMKIKTIGKRLVNTAKVINRFGNAWLIRRVNSRHELIGGTDGDFTAAKEWASLFAHDVVFSRPVKRQRRFPFAARLG